MMGIAEMFAELDGYGRYESAIEVWGGYMTARLAERRNDPYARARRQRTQRIYDQRPERRLSKTLYAKARWRTDPLWREHIRRYKRERSYRKLGATPTQYGPILAKHGTNAGYTRGCRCRGCTDAATQYAREYRARKRAA